MKRLSLLILIYLLTLIPKTGQAVDPEGGFAFSDKVVLVYYYIWYDETKFLETRKVHLDGLHPLVGAYNSWEPAIIDKHLQQMKRAKIDAIAVSWRDDPGEKGQNITLDRVYDTAVKYGLKVTIDFEHAKLSLDKVYQELHYFLARYKNHPAMLKVEGEPVVMIWSAWAHSPKEWKDLFQKLADEGLPSFPIMSGSYRGGTGKDYLDPFRSLEEYTLVDVEDCKLAEFFQQMRQHVDDYNLEKGFKNGKPAQHHATISPGYDETRQKGRNFEHGGWLGAGWKDRGKFGVHYPDDPVGAYYRGTFEAAMKSNPDWLHISTFNELYEWSHIEATFEFGYKYIDLTAEFVEKFKNQKE